MAVGAFLGISLIWGSTWLMIKIGLAGVPPLKFAAGRFLAASVIFAAIVLLRRLRLPATRAQWLAVISPWPATSVWTALYLAAVGTVAAFFLYNWLLQRVAATRVQLQVFLSTVLAVLLGVIVLGETFEWQTALGSLVAVLAVVLSVGLPWRQRANSGTSKRA